jgi:hypothetical protein
MDSPILAPAAVLVLWSMIVVFWVLATRLPAFSKAQLKISEAAPGTRYQEVESVLPASVNWKSHNLTHLMEQPTVFYACVAILALSGAGGGVNATLAWGYVGLRIVHSLWQSLVNTLPVRVTLFVLSSLCLTVMAINAVRITLL